MKFKTLPLSIAALLSANALADVDKNVLPSMIVSADFRPAIALETPVSLTTIDNEIIQSRGAQHLEDVLNLAPNVNISSGASRGQFFQIRGMGQRSQFSSPINPSVGLIIDGIDFSRIGGAATLFDIEQVEILRGPQGTRFGTNALAGVISLQSKQPTEELDIHFETGIAEYNTRNVGLAVGGALIEQSLLGRFSLNSHRSDGYMDNNFLGRDNTQNRVELTAKGQLKWLVSNDFTVDLNLLHLNIDNGYDAFTLDNSRNSLSDEPGEDTLHTNALAVKTDWRASSKVQFQTTTTYNKSDSVYSYDADWGFLGQFAPDLFPYTGTERFQRSRENYSFEAKALSNEDGKLFGGRTEWVIGTNYFIQSEDLDLESTFNTLTNNKYDTENVSLFGQLDTQLTDRITLITGLRIENFRADYTDNNGIDAKTSEVLFGGKLGLNYQLNDNHLAYTSLSRGYKSGGINNNDALPASALEFETEYMWTLETGLKSLWLDGDLTSSVNIFYSDRRNAQVNSSILVGIGDFQDSITNAAKGTNYGLEVELDWAATDSLRLFTAIGLIDASFDEFVNPDPDARDVEGRRIAHAPAYTFTVGTEVYLTPSLTFRANVEGKDDFYFSNSHNEKSGSYALTNASLEYRTGDWKLSLWGRNLFDKDIETRGFFFGNNPGNGYIDENYVQLGEPRVAGVNVTWDY
ncbi:MAG: iron complex outermembrane receptor protein [Methylophagaceae bacterium]|jgi:iron complex outermembrane receptor protein